MIKIVGESTNNPLDRFEEQSHEIKEAQEKLAEIVLAKQVMIMRIMRIIINVRL